MSAQAVPPTEPASTVSPARGGTAATRRRAFATWNPKTALGVALLSLVVGQLVAAGTLLAASGRDLTWIDGAGLMLADLATLAVILVFARRGADHLGPATFGLRRTDFAPALGWGLVAYFAYAAFAAGWALLVGTGGEGGSGGGATSATDAAPIAVALLFAAIAVTVPIVEEVVFRGYLFAALSRWRGPWPAALVSGLLFGAAHVLVHPAKVLLPLAVMGFLLAVIFWISKSLLPCVALHAANNALVLSLSLGWTWQVPLAVVGAASAAVLLLMTISARRAPAAPAVAASVANTA